MHNLTTLTKLHASALATSMTVLATLMTMTPDPEA